ncbi:MAG TPA: GNAT family N-acetyltransferase [Nocardioides sp.]|uniref:GNAT family N-acetyltransferase n=1 Tax=Nocardioides sp. TaxID=35761 RepID=UPI002BB5C6A2|nr:GNAT family N-acetyltransferase [Nocardioides sp.]HQR28110.1 GNAT family N-acetyltransferase [Nocardioides sp.]
MSIPTERLLLRPWRHEDAERVLAVYSCLEVVRWLGDGPPRPMADLGEAHRAVDRWAARGALPPLGVWAVEVAGTGQVAGTVLLARLPGEPDPDGAVEIAWHLHPDSWGHGWATEAAAALLDHGFALGLPEVLALTHLDNTRSQAVCRRLGMRELDRGQEWYDVPMRVFSVTPAER